jgi:hypothetical protein
MTPTLCLALAAALAGFPIDESPEFTAPEAVSSTAGLGWFDPQPGDIIICQAPGNLKHLVYALGCSAGATHSAIVVNRTDGSLAMLEAPGTPYPVMLSDISSRLRSYDGKIWIRRRCVPLTPEQCACLTKFACAQEGKPFATLGVLIPPFGFPVRLCINRCLRDSALDRPRWFCSELVVAAAVSAGLLDRSHVRPRFTDPEDLKTDRCLDLSCGWDKATKWERCGPKLECWWSRSCCGKVEGWKH